jgi:signal transduction histidine kinase
MNRASEPWRAASTLDAALRSLRYPATSLFAVLASTASRLEVPLLAAFVCLSEPPSVRFLGAGGSALPRAGVAGALETVTSAAMDDLTSGGDAVSAMPAGAPEPWSRFDMIASAEATLPGSATLRLIAAADVPIDGEALRDAIGPIAALAAISHATHEADLLREELHRLRQDRTLMAASLQHDLRTPLTSILGSARTLELRWSELATVEREELLGMIAIQTERLTGMVAEAFAREIGSPDAPLRTARADLFAVARRVVAAGRGARGGNVTIQVQPSFIVTDPDRLERALLNLVDNALKYSPPDRPVHLVGESAGTRYTFTVADEGPGVDPEILPSLFAAFATDRSRTGGTGLGLHSVVRLADELGGSVTYSRRGGVTRFCLAIPDLEQAPLVRAGADEHGVKVGGQPG